MLRPPGSHPLAVLTSGRYVTYAAFAFGVWRRPSGTVPPDALAIRVQLPFIDLGGRQPMAEQFAVTQIRVPRRGDPALAG